MAKKADIAAAKQRQQKIILAVLGVVLLAVVAFEGPKMLKKGGSPSSAATAATATTPDTTGATSTTSGSVAATPSSPGTGTAVPAALTAHGPSTTVAGVVVRSAGAPTAATGKLWSLSRFTSKDPFVQQVNETVSGDASTSGAGAGAGVKGGAATTPTPAPTGGASGVVTTTSTPPIVRAYATILVNGNPQQPQVKVNPLFPQKEPTFVLLAVAKSTVKIGVAGGAFTGGKAVELKLGQSVTLMNTATGQRFVLKLVYTGVAPEQIASFKPTAPAASKQKPTSPSSP